MQDSAPRRRSALKQAPDAHAAGGQPGARAARRRVADADPERARGVVAARGITIEQQLDDLLGNDKIQEQLEERRARRRG